VRRDIPPPTMQTSTSSDSLSTLFGSKLSFTSANLRAALIEKARPVAMCRGEVALRGKGWWPSLRHCRATTMLSGAVFNDLDVAARLRRRQAAVPMDCIVDMSAFPSN
jgi:hypothetical protein